MKKFVLKIFNHLLSIFLLLSLFNIVPNASAKSILMSYYTNNGIINSDLYYGSSEWSKMTAAVEDGGNNQVTFVADFEDLSLMLQYNALWLQMRSISCSPDFNCSGTLSSLEINNIRAFIASGRRVVMIGEWGGWPYGTELGWQDWNNQILSIVEGSYDTAYGDSPVAINPVSIINHKLTEGVNELELIGNRYGAANGGLALFEPNFATLWGNIDNVLTVLDTGVFDDSRWDLGDNGQFSTNVADWIAASNAQAQCEEDLAQALDDLEQALIELEECQNGCTPTHNKEKGPRCRDGLDNDCDGMMDSDDPDCQ